MRNALLRPGPQRRPGLLFLLPLGAPRPHLGRGGRGLADVQDDPPPHLLLVKLRQVVLLPLAQVQQRRQLLQDLHVAQVRGQAGEAEEASLGDAAENKSVKTTVDPFCEFPLVTTRWSPAAGPPLPAEPPAGARAPPRAPRPGPAGGWPGRTRWRGGGRGEGQTASLEMRRNEREIHDANKLPKH